MPLLPEQLMQKFLNEYKLSEYDANVLLEQKEIALYFLELCKHTKNYKAAANWLMGPIKSYLNEEAIEINNFQLKPAQIAEIIVLVDEGKINNTVANQQVYTAMLKSTDKKAIDIATELNLIISNNDDELMGFIQEVMAKYPDKVAEYKSGKKGLLGLFMGEVMKLAKGKLDPKAANKILMEALDK